jgi:hypothetical protein
VARFRLEELKDNDYKMKIVINTEEPSIVDQIQACIDAVKALYDAQILVKRLELKQLQQRLATALTNCETNYQQTISGCGFLDVLCRASALEARNQCVYLAQQSYGVCCTTKIGPFPVGGPPCCQSGLCSCTDDLTDPDNMGPQVKKQKEIEALENKKQRAIDRCFTDTQQYTIPSPVARLVVPTMRDFYPDLLWYIWRRPQPWRRRTPGIDPIDVLNDPNSDALASCLAECWIRYNLQVNMLQADLDLFKQQQAEITANCKKDADNEYNAACPAGSLAPNCGVGQSNWNRREAAKQECDSLARSATDLKIEEFNKKMFEFNTALEECFSGCYETIGGVAV